MEGTMEFHEKLQELRKSRGLTQEELAELLYVSRTAISKWESGRGYPSIDSLKAISAYFSVSLDNLLSGEAILTIAEKERKQNESRMCNLVFGLLDCSFVLLLFLPLFGQREGDVVRMVSLIALATAAPYIKAAFLMVTVFTVLFGILLFALQNREAEGWLNWRSRISAGFSVLATLIFIATLQPYAAVFAFGILVIKAFLLIKKG